MFMKYNVNPKIPEPPAALILSLVSDSKVDNQSIHMINFF